MSARRPPPTPRWLGRVPYPEALEAQRAHRARMLAGAADEELWGLEHEPVVTRGRRGTEDGLDVAALAARGVPQVQTERGGRTTWHGPGQLVVYTLVHVHARGHGPASFVEALEEGVVRWLAGLGLAAGRRDGHPGVWRGADKLCAVGLHISGGVAMHGLALNLCPDLSTYALFTPCGIEDGGVSSVERVLGAAPRPVDAFPGLAAELIAAITASIQPREESSR
ncbi:MAG: lipoate-protein ligase [Pseudomonadota bacterium]